MKPRLRWTSRGWFRVESWEVGFATLIRGRRIDAPRWSELLLGPYPTAAEALDGWSGFWQRSEYARPIPKSAPLEARRPWLPDDRSWMQ